MKVAYLSIHPAPYRDPVLAAVHRRGNLELHVFTMFAGDVGHPYQRVVLNEYSNTSLGKGYKLKVPWNSWLHPAILPALWRGGFDVIVVPGYNHATSVLAMLFCWVTNTPLVFSCDAIDFGDQSHRREVLLRFILKRSAAALVPGAESRTYLKRLGFSDKRVFEGTYCLDCAVLSEVAAVQRTRRDSIRASLGISPTGFAFLFAGRMIPQRGLKYLMQAFGQISTEHSNTFLLLVGTGPDRSDIVACSRSIPGVLVLDPLPIEEVAAYYAAADAYVLPSIRETYSLGLAHAAIASLPIITTDKVGAAADYVRVGVTGLIVPAGNVEALACAMGQLATDRAQCVAMGRTAHDVAMTRTTQWAAEEFECAAFAAARSQ